MVLAQAELKCSDISNETTPVPLLLQPGRNMRMGDDRGKELADFGSYEVLSKKIWWNNDLQNSETLKSSWVSLCGNSNVWAQWQHSERERNAARGMAEIWGNFSRWNTLQSRQHLTLPSLKATSPLTSPTSDLPVPTRGYKVITLRSS